jgi:rare lipoprotein A
LAIPEPVPIVEPRSRLGNPAFYEVFGKRYFVLASSSGYVERGVASWYGPGFHKERTATGDPYDMYAMTAAHKTLPLPCYARVTNLNNGRSVVVRINDRGPFKDGRIIDLSYTAATKLDMIRAGTALVEVQVVSSDGGPVTATTSTVASAPLYVQAGAFGDVANAERLVTRLKSLGYSTAFVVKDSRTSRDIHRVRIGPIANAEEFDRVVGHLHSLGIDDARLAGD